VLAASTMSVITNTFETALNFYNATWYDNPEDRHLHVL
jgi:hypothetical protein